MRKIFFILIVFILAVPFPGNGQDFPGRSQSVVTIEGVRYYVHTVGQGETLQSLANAYWMDVDSIVDDNPQVAEGLEPGQVLKLREIKDPEKKLSSRKLNKLFDVHTVNQGETLFSISRRYEITVSTLLEDNPGLDPARLSVGQKLNIRKKSRGETTPEQINRELESYSEAINSVADGFQYHFVKRDETLYGISRRYGLTEQQIKDANNMKDENLRTGDMLIIPVAPQKPSGEQQPDVDPDEIIVDPLDPLWKGDWPWGDGGRRPSGVTIRDFSGKATLKVALMLPLKVEGSNSGGKQYLDLYRGVLLALEDLKREGISVNLTLYNTARSIVEVAMIVNSDSFRDTDIIIGPVYEECFPPVIEFAERTGAAVISPLAVVKNMCSPMLFQMSPEPVDKYAKLWELLKDDKNFVYIKTKYPDEDMDTNLRPLLPTGYKLFDYSGNIRNTSFTNLVDRNKENVFIISCTNEMAVDQILAGISSMQNNLVARSMANGGIKVIGGSRWGRFQRGIDKNLFFKLGVRYVTSYHADRSDERVSDFNKRYTAAFGALPTLYSYRGYDATRLFISSAKSDNSSYIDAVGSYDGELLQVHYRFVDKPDCETHINVNWPLVIYDPEYKVVVD